MAWHEQSSCLRETPEVRRLVVQHFLGDARVRPCSEMRGPAGSRARPSVTKVRGGGPGRGPGATSCLRGSIWGHCSSAVASAQTQQSSSWSQGLRHTSSWLLLWGSSVLEQAWLLCRHTPTLGPAWNMDGAGGSSGAGPSPSLSPLLRGIGTGVPAGITYEITPSRPKLASSESRSWDAELQSQATVLPLDCTSPALVALWSYLGIFQLI